MTRWKIPLLLLVAYICACALASQCHGVMVYGTVGRSGSATSATITFVDPGAGRRIICTADGISCGHGNTACTVVKNIGESVAGCYAEVLTSENFWQWTGGMTGGGDNGTVVADANKSVSFEIEPRSGINRFDDPFTGDHLVNGDNGWTEYGTNSDPWEVVNGMLRPTQDNDDTPYEHMILQTGNATGVNQTVGIAAWSWSNNYGGFKGVISRGSVTSGVLSGYVLFQGNDGGTWDDVTLERVNNGTRTPLVPVRQTTVQVKGTTWYGYRIWTTGTSPVRVRGMVHVLVNDAGLYKWRVVYDSGFIDDSAGITTAGKGGVFFNNSDPYSGTWEYNDYYQEDSEILP